MRTLRDALLLFAVLALLTGLVYPLIVTGLAGALFPGRAAGSLIRVEGRVVGSRLIGQPFAGAGYFWSRPSATTPEPYNAALSGGSNLGPLNPELTKAVAARIAALRAAGGDPAAPVPVDLVTASGSGLDPHLTPAAAYYQAERVAAARGVPVGEIRRLIAGHIEPRQLGLLGEPRVNVLGLNLELDRRFGRAARAGGE
jgi:potassium-transporting ATPase KdpC subunit